MSSTYGKKTIKFCDVLKKTMSSNGNFLFYFKHHDPSKKKKKLYFLDLIMYYEYQNVEINCNVWKTKMYNVYLSEFI